MYDITVAIFGSWVRNLVHVAFSFSTLFILLVTNNQISVFSGQGCTDARRQVGIMDVRYYGGYFWVLGTELGSCQILFQYTFHSPSYKHFRLVFSGQGCTDARRQVGITECTILRWLFLGPGYGTWFMSPSCFLEF
jgi:hypothetical protein